MQLWRAKDQKIPNVVEKIKLSIKSGNYLDTRHALGRQSERNITRLEIIDVLCRGYHEKSKDKFDENFDSWNYSIRGKTLDKRNLRVIVSFSASNMLIITAIQLDK